MQDSDASRVCMRVNSGGDDVKGLSKVLYKMLV